MTKNMKVFEISNEIHFFFLTVPAVQWSSTEYCTQCYPVEWHHEDFILEIIHERPEIFEFFHGNIILELLAVDEYSTPD